MGSSRGHGLITWPCDNPAGFECVDLACVEESDDDADSEGDDVKGDGVEGNVGGGTKAMGGEEGATQVGEEARSGMVEISLHAEPGEEAGRKHSCGLAETGPSHEHGTTSHGTTHHR